MSHQASADRLRGAAVGLLVAALTVAAHGLAGGDYPSLDGLSLLLAVSLSVGALAGSLRARGPVAVVAMLGAGQAAGHYASAEVAGAGHQHSGSAGAPGWLMLAAHATATALCAVLILLSERLYLLISGAVRAVLRSDFRPDSRDSAPLGSGQRDDSLSVATLLGSICRRGPPVPVRAS